MSADRTRIRRFAGLSSPIRPPAVDAGDANSKLNNGINDLNCEDLPGPVKVGANDEDQLDADGNGWGCD